MSLAMDSVLQINGAVANPLWLSVADLSQLYPAYSLATSYANDDRTVNATFVGARLWDVLQSAQVTADPAVDPKLRLMARAADGFRCLIRWHEFDPAVTDRTILIAYQQNGQPMSTSAPLRLVVPGDEHGRRYLRGLAVITVLTQTQPVENDETGD